MWRIGIKINLTQVGEICGLIHDIGKFSNEFQNYIKSANGLIPESDPNWIDYNSLRGKINHSTAGSKLLKVLIKSDDKLFKVLFELISLVTVSHHSGLIDCIDIEGNDVLSTRLNNDPFTSSLGERPRL